MILRRPFQVVLITPLLMGLLAPRVCLCSLLGKCRCCTEITLGGTAPAKCPHCRKAAGQGNSQHGQGLPCRKCLLGTCCSKTLFRQENVSSLPEHRALQESLDWLAQPTALVCVDAGQNLAGGRGSGLTGGVVLLPAPTLRALNVWLQI